jgi:hypothetical protein
MAGLLDDRELTELRQIGDGPADQVVSAFRQEFPELDDRDVIARVIAALRTSPDAQSPWVRRWFEDLPALPAWACPDTIQRGQQVFGRWSLDIATALFCASLPSAYACAKGVEVLSLTSDLATHNITRRIAETGQMLIDVMDLGRADPQTLAPGGRGYTSVRGVRLLHAVIRHSILNSGHVPTTPDESVPLRWSDDWGHPINQEDLLGTLMTFTTVVFAALDRLGVPVDAVDTDDYLHTWNVVGWVLGIEPRLLPIERSEAESLACVIFRRQHQRSDAGIRLMRALLDEMEVSMPWGLRKLPRTLVRHLVGQETADLLLVPPAAWWTPVLDDATGVSRMIARLPGGRAVLRTPSAVLGRSMIRRYVDEGEHGTAPPYRIDPRVLAQLRIGSSPLRRRARRARRTVRRRAFRARHALRDQIDRGRHNLGRPVPPG